MELFARRVGTSGGGGGVAEKIRDPEYGKLETCTV